MKLSIQRKIDRSAGTFLCRIFSLFSGKKRISSDQVEVKQILFILLSELGSLVLAQPMINHAKRKYPNASTYFLVFDQNKEALEFLELVPPENIYSVRNSSLWLLLSDSALALFKIRSQKIDAVIDCELFSRISSIYSLLSGACIKVGFHPYTQEGLYRGSFINRPVLYNPYIHISKQFINMVEAIESNDCPTVKRVSVCAELTLPKVIIQKRDLHIFQSRLKGTFPAISRKQLVLIYPGGGQLPIRAWPLDHFINLSEDLARSGYCVAIIGLKQDKLLAHEIIARIHDDRIIDLTGYTKTIKELVKLFHGASLLITNDGGPGQFASLTALPTVILYGPETPTLYGSLNPRSYNFYISMSCSPCLTAYNHRNSPCDGNNVCLKTIKPNIVLKKALELLQCQ